MQLNTITDIYGERLQVQQVSEAMLALWEEQWSEQAEAFRRYFSQKINTVVDTTTNSEETVH